ncbi:MAG: hypothetical protein GX616_24790 [Planctomycetes bacterium]|nr:hypothetical protein [Planctomycetota bacterium]
MPIFINELVFKGTIEAAGRQDKGQAQATGSPGGQSAEERAALVAAVVAEVLAALERMKER